MLTLLTVSFLIGVGIASVLILTFRSRNVLRNRRAAEPEYELINADVEEIDEPSVESPAESRLRTRRGTALPKPIFRENGPVARILNLVGDHPERSTESAVAETTPTQADKTRQIETEETFSDVSGPPDPERELLSSEQEPREVPEGQSATPQHPPKFQPLEDEGFSEPGLIETLERPADESEKTAETPSLTQDPLDPAEALEESPSEMEGHRTSGVPSFLNRLEQLTKEYNLPDPPLLNSWRPLDSETHQENESKTVSSGVGLSKSFAQELHKILVSLDEEEGKGEVIPPDSYYRLALFAFYAGEFESAVAYLQMTLDSGTDPARPLNLLGLVYHMQGFETEAESRLQEAVETAGASLSDRAIILTNLGLVSTYRRAPDDALEYYAQALEIHRRLENKSEVAETLSRMGRICRAKHSLHEASKYHHEGLEIWRSLGDRAKEALELRLLAAVFREKGDYPDALDLSERALAMNRESGDVREEAINLGNIGLIYSIRKDWSKALEYFHAGLSLHRQVENLRGEAGSLGNIGNILFLQGKTEESLKSYLRALEINRQIGYFWGEAVDLENIAKIQMHLGDSAAAAENLREARRLFIELNATAQAEAVQTTLQAMGALEPQES